MTQLFKHAGKSLGVEVWKKIKPQDVHQMTFPYFTLRETIMKQVNSGKYSLEETFVSLFHTVSVFSA